jgi:diaminopimelate epimerase
LNLHFYKYQATGNDFVLVDNRLAQHAFSKEQIEKICDRKFGVGADGLMLIEKHPAFDFNLVYYNSDGSQSLCGNGSRAAVSLAASLGMLNGKTSFNAYDGAHSAEVLPSGIVRLKMNEVKKAEKHGDDYFINTGSPHYIRFVKDLEQFPVFTEGEKIRYSDAFKPAGTNVNFVEVLDNNTLFVRTYERGVEDETLSCGTGVVAAALAASFKGFSSPVSIKTRGGDLSVQFNLAHNAAQTGQEGIFTEIFLVGPAKLVFEGDLEL